jgi:signal-transduction protein with cAMP-binding, CBS, and nucleotidyltransferase domain
MEKINSKETYSQLRGYLCKDGAMLVVDWLKFIDKTDIFQFKANEVIAEACQPSTHSYFIISGLIMCHQPHEHKAPILWFRAENDYAFTAESLGHIKDFGYKEQLIALEDTVVVGINHEDKAELMKNSRQITDLMGDAFMNTAVRFAGVIDRDRYPKEDRYGFLQENIGFNLNRIPDAYLAAYLHITAKMLKESREAISK